MVVLPFVPVIADRGERLGGTTEQQCGHRPHRRTNGGDAKLGHVDVEPPLHDEG